jgi:anti-anti-sigma regulatory factor
MNFKIDTREKFTVITPVSDFLSDNLTAEFLNLTRSFIESRINLIINLKNVTTINERLIEQIAALHQEFYNKNLSFVLCEVQNGVQSMIAVLESDDELNIIPSETEAWDMVQMEEIERELMSENDNV